MLKPDYDRSILSISSSILKKYGLVGNYLSLKELDKELEGDYKNIVLLILDCMGSEILELHQEETKFLRSHLLTNVTSVFPPTTAAATTAYHSGLSPLESGWVGWMPYFKEYDRMIELFSGCDFYTGENIVKNGEINCLKYETIYDKIIKKNKDVKFTKVFPDFERDDNSFEKIVDGIKTVCNNSCKNIISAYWTEPDSSIHKYGTKSLEVAKQLKNINDNLENLVKELKNTILIISADHGGKDVEVVYLNEYKDIDDCLIRPPSIESRFVSFFVKDDKKEEFKKLIINNFGDKFLIYSKEEFFKLGLLGRGVKHPRIDDFIGDFILIGDSNLDIRYIIDDKRKKIVKGDHSGITKEEMMVPVIVIKEK